MLMEIILCSQILIDILHVINTTLQPTQSLPVKLSSSQPLIMGEERSETVEVDKISNSTTSSKVGIAAMRKTASNDGLLLEYSDSNNSTPMRESGFFRPMGSFDERMERRSASRSPLVDERLKKSSSKDDTIHIRIPSTDEYRAYRSSGSHHSVKDFLR